jgi:hypothetical protein
VDALVDCLRGTFGCTAPATLVRQDAATAREHLSHVLRRIESATVMWGSGCAGRTNFHRAAPATTPGGQGETGESGTTETEVKKLIDGS